VAILGDGGVGKTAFAVQVCAGTRFKLGLVDDLNTSPVHT